MKRCGVCRTEKPLSEFHKGARRCKPCACAATRAWYVENKGRIPKLSPEAIRSNNLRRYGITQAEYDVMLEEQAGRCAACWEFPTSGRGKRLHVDHDHITGRIRGLLCHGCNAALGLVKERPEVLVDYLEKCRANA